MRKQLKQFLVVGGIVLGGCQTILPYSVAHATEIIDEKGEKWTDITEAIKRWPLNTFNTMYISEYDFLNNGLSVVFNGINASGEGFWKADELMMGWVNYSGIFKRDEFAGLVSFDETDRYIPLVHLRMDEPIGNGTEIEITPEMITGRIIDNFYGKKLTYVIRNSDGEATRANYNSAFQCAIEVREGQVCRLFYRDPVPGGGASSGLTKYFPVQKTEADKEAIGDEESPIETEVEGNMSVIEMNTGESESAAKAEIGKNEPITEGGSLGSDEQSDKNTLGDINNDAMAAEVPENGEKYSSGDIFVSDADRTTPISNNVEKASSIAILSAGRGQSGGSGGASGVVNDNKENNISEIEELIRASEEEKMAEEGIGEIEVPRLGMTAKKIDYKWLFLPVLGLVLMIYWWFFVPIWKKREKSTKKSKKSVDNI